MAALASVEGEKGSVDADDVAAAPRLTRQYSNKDRTETVCPLCYCTMGSVTEETSVADLRLGCGCLLHYMCFVDYVRAKMNDRLGMDARGIPCPYGGKYGAGCSYWKKETPPPPPTPAQGTMPPPAPRPPEHRSQAAGSMEPPAFAGRVQSNRFVSASAQVYFITLGDLDAMTAWGEQHYDQFQSLGCEPLSQKEVNALREWIREEEQRKAGGAMVETSDNIDPYVMATTKGCPSCGYRGSHYHGHHCHHVSSTGRGCPSCHTEYCYKCLRTAAENTEKNGDKEMCDCGCWSNFCSELKSETDIYQYLCTDPVPHDTRCGCTLCPDCREKKPCPECDGDCVVCLGILNPGPLDLETPWQPPSRALMKIAVAVKENDADALSEAIATADDDCDLNAANVGSMGHNLLTAICSKLNPLDKLEYSWRCPRSECNCFNEAGVYECEGCLKSPPEEDHEELLKTILLLIAVLSEHGKRLDINCPDKHGRIPLVCAVKSGRVPLVECLLRNFDKTIDVNVAGVVTDYQDEEEWQDEDDKPEKLKLTPLLEAIRGSNIDVVTALLKHPGIASVAVPWMEVSGDINVTGESPLFAITRAIISDIKRPGDVNTRFVLLRLLAQHPSMKETAQRQCLKGDPLLFALLKQDAMANEAGKQRWDESIAKTRFNKLIHELAPEYNDKPELYNTYAAYMDYVRARKTLHEPEKVAFLEAMREDALSVVKTRVRVTWRDGIYDGVITECIPPPPVFTIVYDDGDIREYTFQDHPCEGLVAHHSKHGNHKLQVLRFGEAEDDWSAPTDSAFLEDMHTNPQSILKSRVQVTWTDGKYEGEVTAVNTPIVGAPLYKVVYDDGDVREYTFVDGQKEFCVHHAKHGDSRVEILAMPPGMETALDSPDNSMGNIIELLSESQGLVNMPGLQDHTPLHYFLQRLKPTRVDYERCIGWKQEDLSEVEREDQSEPSEDDCPEGCKPMFISTRNDHYSLKTGPCARDIVPYKLFRTEDCLEEIRSNGFRSDFFCFRDELSSYSEEEVLVVADVEAKYGETWMICLTKAAKDRELQAITAAESQGQVAQTFSPSNDDLVAKFTTANRGSGSIVDDTAATGHLPVSWLEEPPKNANALIFKRLFDLPHLDVNRVDDEGQTALVKVVATWSDEDDQLDFIKVLERAPNFDINHPDLKTGMSALAIAVQRQNIPVAQFLLRRKGIKVSQPDKLGYTALHYACKALRRAERSASLTLVKSLVEAHCDLNINDTPKGESPLMVALGSNNLEVAELLLATEGIGDTTETAKSKETVWHAAATAFDIHEALFQTLLKTGAGRLVNYVGDYSGTALSFVCEVGNLAMLKLLLSIDGVNVNAIDVENENTTPLFQCCEIRGDEMTADDKTKAKMAELLLLHGADPNIKDREVGACAIHVACENDALEQLKVLLKHEACDVNVLDYSGRPPVTRILDFGGAPEMLLSFLECPRLDVNTLDIGDENYDTEAPTVFESCLAKYWRDNDVLTALLKCPNIEFRLDKSKVVRKHTVRLILGLLKNEKALEAESLCKLAIARKDDSQKKELAILMELRARACEDMHRSDEAETIYGEIWKLCQESKSMFNEEFLIRLASEIARNLSWTGKHEKAESLLRIAFAEITVPDPHSTILLSLRLGEILLAQGKVKEARLCFEGVPQQEGVPHCLCNDYLTFIRHYEQSASNDEEKRTKAESLFRAVNTLLIEEKDGASRVLVGTMAWLLTKLGDDGETKGRQLIEHVLVKSPKLRDGEVRSRYFSKFEKILAGKDVALEEFICLGMARDSKFSQEGHDDQTSDFSEDDFSYDSDNGNPDHYEFYENDYESPGFDPDPAGETDESTGYDFNDY